MFADIKAAITLVKRMGRSKSTTLDLLNDWCSTSRCLSCPTKPEQNLSDSASIDAHVEPQLVPVQSNTLEQALWKDTCN